MQFFYVLLLSSVTFLYAYSFGSICKNGINIHRSGVYLVTETARLQLAKDGCNRHSSRNYRDFYISSLFFRNKIVSTTLQFSLNSEDYSNSIRQHMKSPNKYTSKRELSRETIESVRRDPNTSDHRITSKSQNFKRSNITSIDDSTSNYRQKKKHIQPLFTSSYAPKSYISSPPKSLNSSAFNGFNAHTTAWSASGRSFRDELTEVVLEYDYLAPTSLHAVEAFPFVQREKGDWYFIRWWKAGVKWGILTGELLQEKIRQELEYKTMNSTSLNLINSDSEQFIDEPTHSKGSYRVGGGNSSAIPRVPFQLLAKVASTHRARVICIGDVHGCIDELCDLLRAVEYKPGDLVLFLGDLVAKGPESAAVIRMAMDIGAISVRGNHDFEVTRHALLQSKTSIGSNARSFSAEHLRIAQSLDPAEVEWLSALPLYVRSPDLGFAFVHAGFDPNRTFDQQEPWVMMTARSIVKDGKMTPRCVLNQPWGAEWRGPMTILYGHDAARGFQKYSHAMCADTGCVYGGNLTALLLPDELLVSVPARKAYIQNRKIYDDDSITRGTSSAELPTSNITI